MPVQTPSELANEARCYDARIPSGMQRSTELYLLAQLVKTADPDFDVSPQSLVKEARCFNSCIPSGMEAAVANYLLNQLVANGCCSGGGNYIGDGPPPDSLVVADGSRYTDRLTAADYYYDVVAGGWIARSV